MSKKKKKTSKPVLHDRVLLIEVNIKTHNDNKGGHPHVIVDDFDDRYVSVGLTTKPKKGKNATNYVLEKNPLGGNEKSYMRRQGTVAKKRNYNRPRTGSMTSEDHAKAREYGERAKQKYIKKKNNKKK